MKWRKGDLIIIAIILFVAIAIWVFPFGRTEPTDVDVFKDGKLVYTTSIAGAFEKEIAGCTVKLSEGEVRVLSSTCPDKVCVSTGAISQSGEIIVCVPNRVSVKVTGKQKFDAVAS